MTRRVVVGITGATGQIYGVRAIEMLAELDCEIHLIVSDAARVTAKQELNEELQQTLDLATEVHPNRNIGAPPASGSFQTGGMIIAPCSMKSLANIANGNAANLLTRSADVTLKERRPLVLLPREKPFNRIHLQNMLAVTDAGAIVYPPFPSYYQADADFSELIGRSVARALSYLDDISVEYEEWRGIEDGIETEQ